MRITIFGAGYVGLANAVMLATQHEVTLVDIIPSKVESINKRVSPIVDKDIQYYFENKKLNLRATLDSDLACKDRDVCIIATPTNYDPNKEEFDTTSVESVIHSIRAKDKNVTIVVKSTVPIGFVDRMISEGNGDILFVPEFLREGCALYDSLHPNRIVVGGSSSRKDQIGEMFRLAAIDENVPVIYTGATEAEAIKLFSNTYLAMRVAYFNELDTFSETLGLKTKEIIDGVTLDPRIGQGYCNPSFGYGGYCLPKDSKQLLSNFRSIPETMIAAIVKSNDIRKSHIVDMVLKRRPSVVGIYRLIMKSNSDNFRSAAILDIISLLKSKGIRVLIYEPTLKVQEFMECKVLNTFDELEAQSDVILANRVDGEVSKIGSKLYSRDIYGIG